MQFNYDAYKAGAAIPNKKTQEQEFMEKARLLNLQSQLQDSQLSDTEKKFRLMVSDPKGYREFTELNNMITPYQQGMLGIQRGQLGVQSAKLGADSLTPQQKNYQFLRSQGVPHDEAMERAGLKTQEKKKLSFD